jgi:VIT1/CCC1 family predicted Fe2+/Mn2+ transporter
VDTEERADAVLGIFDGSVSIVGVVFGLLIHHAARGVIGVAALSGAVAATVSMSSGIYEAQEGTRRRKLRDAGVMGVSTLIGSLVPAWPFFVFGRAVAIAVGSVGCLLVACWIGWEKRAGLRGYRNSVLVLLGAVAATLLIVGWVPT